MLTFPAWKQRINFISKIKNFRGYTLPCLKTEDKTLVKQTLQMYVNSSLTAQRIQKFVLVLGSFGLETALTREKISVWESLFSLKFRWIPKDADLCLSLKSFRWESWNSIRVTAPSVENFVLLKCRKLRREDQETSDSIVSRISLFYDMCCYL